MTTENNTEVAVIDPAFSDDALRQSLEILNRGGGGGNMFSTIKGGGRAEKLATLSAMTASVPVSENLNKSIKVAHIIVQKIEMADETTGELKPQPRIVLIDEGGTAYHAISGALYKSVENIIGIFGSDPAGWGGPIPIKIVQEGSGTRKYFTARVELDKLDK